MKVGHGMMVLGPERSCFKTVREIELEQKIADLERALYRQTWGHETDIMMTPRAEEHIREGAAPPSVMVRVPQVASIRTVVEDGKRTLGVAAYVHVPEPFGLSYYCEAGLLANNAIAAQVLGHLHERFMELLGDFVRRSDDRASSKASTQ
jgi:hypothetical protein